MHVTAPPIERQRVVIVDERLGLDLTFLVHYVPGRRMPDRGDDTFTEVIDVTLLVVALFDGDDCVSLDRAEFVQRFGEMAAESVEAKWRGAVGEKI